jgi:hypothetical protein
MKKLFLVLCLFGMMAFAACGNMNNEEVVNEEETIEMVADSIDMPEVETIDSLEMIVDTCIEVEETPAE